MSAAPYDQLNEDERQQLHKHLSRQARKRSQAVGGAGNSLYHTPPSTHPRTNRAVTPPDTRLTTITDLDDEEVANAQEEYDGEIDGAQLNGFLDEGPPNGWDAEDQRNHPVALETASAPKPHDPADEQENHISGGIDEARAAEQSIGHNVTGHGGGRLPAAGPRQTLLATPNASARDQGQSAPWHVHTPFVTPTSPLAIRKRGKAHARGQEGNLRLTIGPVSVEAQLHMLPSGPGGVQPAEEPQELDETAFQGGDGPILVVDPESVLVCAGIITVLWGFWWLFSM